MHISLLLSILVTVYCAPVENILSRETILSSENVNDGSGNYNFSYSTSNGISREEEGTVVNRGKPDEHIEVRGWYSYLRADGRTERVEYTANNNGFQYSTRNILDIMNIMDKKKLSPALVATLLGK